MMGLERITEVKLPGQPDLMGGPDKMGSSSGGSIPVDSGRVLGPGTLILKGFKIRYKFVF